MRATLHVVGTACLAARLLAGSSVLAAESDPVTTARSTASLVSDSDTFGAGHTLRVGLRLRLAPRWHTYWRNPGDAGVAPELTFTWPAGVTASAVEWPVPARQSENDLTTFGYTGDVLLPVEVTVAANAPLPVSLHAEWLVCERVCVPERGDFRLSLAAGPGMPSPQAPLFAAADLHTPRSSPWPARYDPGGTLRLTGADLGPRSVRSAEFLPDDPRVAAGTTQRVAVTEGEVAIGLGPIAGTAPLHGVVVLQDGGGQQSAFEVAALPGPASVAARMGLLRAVGVALLGGLLLNVMPCVFPVLAMKAAGLAGLGGQDRGRARALGLSYLAGVVATFCALGGVLLGLREAGGFGGWGFQFQDPRFVAAMAWVLFLVGLNLSGVFRMGAGRLSGAGQALAGREGHLGSFATGALAVLVASPCTAPFMAAAVAAALAAPPVFALAVFAALGLGLAFPYVLLAWLPGLRLPRPGAWMEVARQALAFPMYATVAWLAWVFLQQTGPDGMPVLAGGLVALALAGWLVGLRQRGGGRWLPAAAVALGLAVVASMTTISTGSPAVAAADAFTPARLASLRQAGRPVFVDMGAAWCVTCLVNERVALAPPSVRDAFARRGVTLLHGDWTRQDPDITGFLREHGRDGVPLYVYFPRGGAAPVLLPPILTPQIVLEALGGPASS